MVGELDLSGESWETKLKWWAGTIMKDLVCYAGEFELFPEEMAQLLRDFKHGVHMITFMF